LFSTDVTAQNWLGGPRSRSIVRVIEPAGDNIHRIKADEKNGICIVSHNNGGLTVTELGSIGKQTKVLWSLPSVRDLGWS
jgi:hypothetical protein